MVPSQELNEINNSNIENVFLYSIYHVCYKNNFLKCHRHDHALPKKISKIFMDTGSHYWLKHK